jgi:hypothetical protein
MSAAPKLDERWDSTAVDQMELVLEMARAAGTTHVVTTVLMEGPAKADARAADAMAARVAKVDAMVAEFERREMRSKKERLIEQAEDEARALEWEERELHGE